MYLYSLDKKMMTVYQRFSTIEFQDILTKHNMTKEQLETEVQKQLYSQLALGCAKNIKTAVVKNDSEVQYTVRGFILTEQNVNELVREIFELTQEERQKFLEEITAKQIHKASDGKTDL